MQRHGSGQFAFHIMRTVPPRWSGEVKLSIRSNATKNASSHKPRNLTMQSRKLLLIGASLGALIKIGTAGAAEAPQSPDSATEPSHHAKASSKSSVDSSKEMAAQLQPL